MLGPAERGPPFNLSALVLPEIPNYLMIIAYLPTRAIMVPLRLPEAKVPHNKDKEQKSPRRA